MKQLTLHIGLPKTGSTSLQHYLLAHREALESEGICYPRTGLGIRVAHHDIAHACRGFEVFRGRLGELRRSLDAEVASFDHVILSSEAFQSGRVYPGVVRFFGAPGLPRRRGQHITTVCYIRELLDMVCSEYAQRAQATDMSASFATFCKNRFRRPLWSILAFWRGFSDATSFGLYDRGQLRNGDIVEDFFDRIGIALPGAPVERDANPSISGNLLGFKLLLNSYGLHNPRHYRIFAELALADPAYRGRFSVADKDAGLLRQRFASHNKTLEKLVGRVPLRSFADDNPLPNPETWEADLERFLSHPGLARLRDRPEIARARASHVSTLVGLSPGLSE